MNVKHLVKILPNGQAGKTCQFASQVVVFREQTVGGGYGVHYATSSVGKPGLTNFGKVVFQQGSLKLGEDVKLYEDHDMNKVIDYNPTNPESTKCEFLRVIELSYT